MEWEDIVKENKSNTNNRNMIKEEVGFFSEWYIRIFFDHTLSLCVFISMRFILLMTALTGGENGL